MSYAVILAGGAGTRLWPLSRVKRPKQLIPLLAGKSLLELAVERLAGLFDLKDIWVITNDEYADQVAATLKMLPRENIVGEPVGRDTSNAICLAAEMLALRDPGATMAVFTADHVIRPVESFQRTVRTAMAAIDADPAALLTFGIRPSWPHTGLGYVHCGRRIEGDLFQVSAFKEKPDHHTARRYVESGEYFWNSGMFVWKLAAIRGALGEFLPQSKAKLEAVAKSAAAGGDLQALLKETYPGLPRISIDFAVMEKAKQVLMVELKCEWLDVGSWPALEHVTELDESGNIIIAKNSYLLDCLRNIVVSEDGHLLALVGVDDLIVVNSPEATLVCNKSDAQRLKELTGLIEKKFGDKFT
jgi:mannose-1-phosphate guanylyltransferase